MWREATKSRTSPFTKPIAAQILLVLAVLSGCTENEPAPKSGTGEGSTVMPKPEAMNPRTDEPSEQHEYLQVQFTNNTDDLIDQTSVTFGSNQCTFGMLGQGGAATFLGWTNPVGTNSVVSWRDKQKLRREQTVDFSKIYDPEKAGTLNFTITQTNVFATFVRIDRK